MGIHDLEHDHATLTNAVEDLRAQALSGKGDFPDERFLAKIVEVADELFEHFAREEEGLFPYILDVLPDQAEVIAQMQAAHDRICGAASRIAQLAERPNADLAVSLFRRFDAEYTGHAKREAEFLRSLAARLTSDQQETLAGILREI